MDGGHKRYGWSERIWIKVKVDMDKGHSGYG